MSQLTQGEEEDGSRANSLGDARELQKFSDYTQCMSQLTQEIEEGVSPARCVGDARELRAVQLPDGVMRDVLQVAARPTAVLTRQLPACVVAQSAKGHKRSNFSSNAIF